MFINFQLYFRQSIDQAYFTQKPINKHKIKPQNAVNVRNETNTSHKSTHFQHYRYSKYETPL